MSREGASRRTPVIISFVIGLMLTIVPLPATVEAFRPDWLAILVIFWAMQLPRTWSVGTAWIIGIVLDVTQGTFLGQHALALVFVAFITVRIHLLMRVFPIAQLTATVLPILACYQFILFWVNGVAGVSAPAITYWAPIVSGTVMWPAIMMLLSGLRFRARAG